MRELEPRSESNAIEYSDRDYFEILYAAEPVTVAPDRPLVVNP